MYLRYLLGNLGDRLQVLGVVNSLTLGGIDILDAVGKVLLNLTANNLHRTVNQSVLLGEGLAHDSQRTRQPAVGELVGILSTCTVLIDLRADSLGSLTQ